MSIKYRIDPKRDLICTLWEGRVTAEEWLAHLGRMTADPDWPAITRMLCDLRTVSDVSTIGAAEIARAVELLKAAPGELRNKRCAIPATRAFLVATDYQKAISPFEPGVVVFNSLETACLYLGIDPAEARGFLEHLRNGAG